MLNRLVSLKGSNQTGLDYFMPRLIGFISCMVVLAFVLTQLNAYDSFAILAVLFLFILIKFLNLTFKKPLRKQLFKIRSRMILYTVRNLEQHKNLISTVNFRKKLWDKDTDQQPLAKKDYYWQLGLVIGIGIFTYASRYYFFYFDTYALSDLWYQDFSKIKDLQEQKWLFNEGVLMGEYVLIQLYASLTDISDVIALQTFGLLENAVLGVVLFWTVSKLTNTKYVPGLFAAFMFMVFYTFLPLNINLMTQHKPTFLALSIALPAFVYLCKPTALRIKLKTYTGYFFLFFLGIAFIDLFTMLFIVPALFTGALLSLTRDKAKYYRRALLVYTASLCVFLLVYSIASYANGSNLWEFLRLNLYSFKAYTYVPQLIVPVDKLIGYYLLLAIICLGITALFRFKFKEKLKHVVSLFLVCSILFALPILELDILDIDLLYQVISVFIPLCYGGFLYVFFFLISKVCKPVILPIPVRLGLVILLIAGAYLFFEKSTLQQIPERNLTNEYVIEAYDALDAQLLPFSFTVINTAMTAEVSKSNHFFDSYDYFNTNYERADSIYSVNRENIAYLRANPNATLSKSVFVFIYHKNARLNKAERLDREDQSRANEVLNSLLAKGMNRTSLFYKTTIDSV